MIRQSFIVKGISAIVISVVAHIGFVAALGLSKEPTLIEGGAPTEISMLGDNFEDMVAAGDNLEPTDPDETSTADTPDPIEPVVPDPVRTTEKPEKIPEPDTSDPIEPIKPDRVQATEEVEKIPDVETPQRIEPTKPDLVKTTDTSDRLKTATIMPDQISPAKATQPAQITALAPQEIKPVIPISTSRITSPQTTKPVEVTRQLAAIAPPPVIKPLLNRSTTTKRKKKTSPPTPRKTVKKKRSGLKNAKATTSRKKGRVDGDANARTLDKGKKSNRRSQRAGNAAVSNYPGKVQRRISRLRPKRVNGKGTARIRFIISASGSLASISIARSSGSSEIDRAALSLIRRAAPFPKPPQGARRNYVIPVRVRG